jgi:hypothetical protein
VPLVYRFQTWDSVHDAFRQSGRLATKEAIKQIGGQAVSEGLEVGEKFICQEIPGMTARDFDLRFR